MQKFTSFVANRIALPGENQNSSHGATLFESKHRFIAWAPEGEGTDQGGNTGQGLQQDKEDIHEEEDNMVADLVGP